MTAYRPTPVPLSHLEAELAVEQDGVDVVRLLLEVGGTVDTQERVLDTKACKPRPMHGPSKA